MTKEIIETLQAHEEKIDAHLAEHDAKLTATNDVAVEVDGESTTVKMPDIGAIYHAVRPVLLFARAILFFKPKWQAAISTFVAALDELYPQAN